MIFEDTKFKGLTDEEVLLQRKKYGENMISSKKKVSKINIFLSQFNDFIIWVLIAATLISGFMGERADAITIIIIVIMNAIMGFIQEYKTEKSLEALKNLAAPTAKVIRNGNLKVISASEIVCSDIIYLEGGDRVPADAILLEGNNVIVDESLLTGESVGVNKDSKGKANSIFMGTIILSGNAIAKVINIGMKTEMGKIADMLQNIESDKSPLKEKLAHLGKIMVIICIIICAIVTEMGILRGQDKYQMFLLGVSLAVAAIPEGLPAIVTVALALGVSRMLKRNALVRKLPAVETLGCTSIICSDKTGTLTENNMKVVDLFTNGKRTKKINEENNGKQLRAVFSYCNDCNIDFKEKDINKALLGDPTETSLIKAYFDDVKEYKTYRESAHRVYEMPFDSDRKMMSVMTMQAGVERVYVKGAPEKVIARCKYIWKNGKKEFLSSEEKKEILYNTEQMSKSALRCIAAAFKDEEIRRDNSMETNLTFVGIAGIIDPPRPEAYDAVLKCRIAGIKPIMITGDHKDTAFAIAKELNIAKGEEQVLTGDDIDNLNDSKLREKVKGVTVFARVNPSHKLRIVRAFKKNNHIVAMTGDGVNDAPAVKEADIGVSMGISGTDVTKEASSMILLDDNFSTIVSAVEEGRVIYDNIRKFIRYLLSCNLGEVLTMFLASLLYLDAPLLPIQILLVNLATDGLPALALGVDGAEPGIMNKKPRPKNESIFAGGLKEKIAIRGSLIGVCTLLSFIMAAKTGLSIEGARTVALGTLIMSQLLHVFECRSMEHSIFEIKFYTNLYLLGAVSVSVIMLLCVLYIPFLQGVFHTIPLDFPKWMIVIFFSGIISFINSLYLYLKK